MRKRMYIPKNYLLLLAGFIWLLAGINILNIGYQSTSVLTLWMMPATILTFLVFYFAIFRKLIHKHTNRILQYAHAYMHILQFFDRKSYIIMFCMMSGGILLRKSHVWPTVCIKSFYTGIGLALCISGLCFIKQFYHQQLSFTNK